MFRLPARALASLTLLAAIALSAHADNQSVWTGKANGGLATLELRLDRYTQESGISAVLFQRHERRSAEDIRDGHVEGVEAGKPLTIQLLAGTGHQPSMSRLRAQATARKARLTPKPATSR